MFDGPHNVCDQTFSQPINMRSNRLTSFTWLLPLLRGNWLSYKTYLFHYITAIIRMFTCGSNNGSLRGILTGIGVRDRPALFGRGWPGMLAYAQTVHYLWILWIKYMCILSTLTKRVNEFFCFSFHYISPWLKRLRTTISEQIF